MHIWKINPISTCYIISEDVWYCTSFNGSTGQWTKAKWHGSWVRWADQFTSRELSRMLCIFRPRNHGFFGAYSLFCPQSGMCSNRHYLPKNSSLESAKICILPSIFVWRFVCVSAKFANDLTYLHHILPTDVSWLSTQTYRPQRTCFWG